MSSHVTRRSFIAAAPAAAAAAKPGKPALLGGAKVRATPFRPWPVASAEEEKAILSTLRSGKWFRGSGQNVLKFEQAYASLTGSPFCLATANGTSALYVSLNTLGVEPGDEVIVPPYTFVATVNAVLRQFALPVFVDTDPETFQMDHRKAEAAFSERTKAIMPVHLGGAVCDLDALVPLARKHNAVLIEDACQAHLAEWKGRKVGTFGDAGCFSFQESKNLSSGEGGAILFKDEALMERAYAFHNNGSGRGRGGVMPSYAWSGANLRLTEFQAALLLARMDRLASESKTRSENAAYLSSMLEKIPGIKPVKMHAGCTNNAWHLYMFRYDPQAFSGLPRAAFLKAMAAEGIPASGGYTPLNKQPFIKNVIESKPYRKLFPANVINEWAGRNECPANDRLCSEAVWFTQNMLLGPRSDMDQIVEAVTKIQAHAGDISRT
jgi:dTDP-4-amino-4,6-dideoxygalactose transaminase